MERKIVLLKDLTPETAYPVVELLKSNGERLGCATTAIINWSVLLGLLDKAKPENVAEMALFYEMELRTDKKGNVEAKRFAEVLEGLLSGSSIERYVLRTRELPFGTALALLANGFSGLLCSNTPGGGGHADVVFYRAGKVYYNAFEMNARQLAELLYGDEGNVLIVGRDMAHYGRAFITRQEMANLAFKLTEEERVFLGEYEVFIVENTLLKISENFWNMPLEEIVKEKEATLKALGLLGEDTRVI